MTTEKKILKITYDIADMVDGISYDVSELTNWVMLLNKRDFEDSIDNPLDIMTLESAQTKLSRYVYFLNIYTKYLSDIEKRIENIIESEK